jgi:hypothetical protein
VSRPPKQSARAPVGNSALIILKTSATAEADTKKGRFYKPLPKQFRRDGFDYREIAREGNAAIYEQRWAGCAESSLAYEVIRIRRRDGFPIGSRFVPPGEVYPASKFWGVDGFTFTDRDAAFSRLRELQRSSSNSPQKEPS